MVMPTPNDAVGTRLLYENEICKVWLLRLEGGEASQWHVHQCAYTYVVTRPGDTVTEFVDGTEERCPDHVGFARYLGSDAGHRLVNEGNTAYENIIVEFKGVAHGR